MADESITETCDMLYLAQLAALHVPSALAVTSSTLIDGLEAIGTSFASAGAKRVSFGHGRHNGGSAFQRIAYVDACSCFQYVSNPLPL